MKFLAIERAAEGASIQRMRELLGSEAGRVWELYRSGVAREIYFTAQHDAVLILECSSEPEAADALATLPLVRDGQIRFELLALNPYTGFERLFGGAAV